MIIVATRNAHKILEIQSILGNSHLCVGMEKFPGAPSIKEDAASFIGNASKKAVELARSIESGPQPLVAFGPKPRFILADDSGLEVDLLKGAPGVHSARFAALDSGQPGNSSDADNRTKLLRALKDMPADKRTARFRCVLAM